MARYFLAASPGQQVHLPVNPELGRPEHHEFRWVDSRDAQRLLPPRLQPILAWAQELIGAHGASGGLEGGRPKPDPSALGRGR